MFVNEIKDVFWLQGSLYAISEVCLNFEKFNVTTFSWRIYEMEFVTNRFKNIERRKYLTGGYSLLTCIEVSHFGDKTTEKCLPRKRDATSL